MARWTVDNFGDEARTRGGGSVADARVPAQAGSAAGSLAGGSSQTIRSPGQGARAADETRLMSQALHLLQQGNPSQAEALYRQVLAATPQNPEARHLLGV